MEIINQLEASKIAIPIYEKKYKRFRTKIINKLHKAIHRGWSSVRIRKYTTNIDNQLYIKMIDRLVIELRDNGYRVNINEFKHTPSMLIVDDSIVIDILPVYGDKEKIDDYCKDNTCYICLEPINSLQFLVSCGCVHLVHLNCYNKMAQTAKFGEVRCGICRKYADSDHYSYSSGSDSE